MANSLPMSNPAMIQYLLQTTAWPQTSQHITLHETHISWVILTGSHAYKIKKPVNLGFVDFSTLAKRQHYCQEEVIRNRRFGSTIYLGVVPVRRQGDSYNMDGDGEIVDYAVKMRQFADHDLLLTRLQNHAFEAAWLDELATTLAHSHDQAQPHHAGDAAVRLDQHMQDCLTTLMPHMPEAVQWHQQWQQRMAQLAPVLQQRQQASMVRCCHGDYHLGNLTLINDHPQAFDCIEFNDELATIDTMNDAAFLFMDLLAHQRPDLAMRFISRYLEQSGDDQGAGTLRLFAAYRAAVRAKVSILQTGTANAKTQHYCALMEQLLNEAPRPPQLIAIGGYSGSGKSHLALRGCGPMQAVIVRSDALRRRLHRQFPHLERYGEAMNARTRDAVMQAARQLLAARWSVILDATFLTDEWRQRARNIATEQGAGYQLIWLDTPPETQLQRIRQRRGDVSEADEAILRQQWQQFTPPPPDQALFWPDSNRWPDRLPDAV